VSVTQEVIESTTERTSREAINQLRQRESQHLSALPQHGLLRRICLFISNAILQFPLAFETQQKALRQPTLLRAEVEEELEIIRKTENDFVVLDYGCGSGTYSGLFNHQNYVGIDCNEAMLERASSVHPQHTFIKATNLSGISTRIGDVSEVLMVGVIHHLSQSDLISILKTLPKNKPIRLLAIDTLKCSGGLGAFVQLFERGEFLRSEKDHMRLLHRVADEISYKKVPYGNLFELAVFRGTIKNNII
jgi:2-polyprenyl-3-methyl-5-hydroxy-6-metoxy-1,4-benzoquinol methylase